MQKLNLPFAQLIISQIENKSYVFDLIRKKHILLTPEEWVRQNFLHFLMNYLHYPKALCAIERGLKYHTLRKRTDITIYDQSGKVFMVVECKASHIPLTQKTFEQAANYSYSLMAKYLVVTNGLRHLCCRLNHESKTYEFLENLPKYES
ncbi:MAG: type I restriction enzyme HsdR N-terminal domain-containing protein [Cytophagales bacterium]|nr:MAG: type I restriction enzyme HsdR N-terminal domain-containing protein [Cytophagales bacterium]